MFASVIKRYPFTIIVVVCIWVVSLVPIPETPMDNVMYIDKWTHIVMYLVLAIVAAWEYLFRGTSVSLDMPGGMYATRRRWLRLLLLCFIGPALMGGLVELAQRYLTNGIRTGDWLDFFADATGALLGFLLSLFVLYPKRKK